MRRQSSMLLYGILLISLGTPLQSQSPNPATGQRYRIIEIKKRKDLQPELDRAAAAGERLVWGNGYLGLLITEPQADAAVHYEYLVRDLVYEDELKKAGEAGFRLPCGNRNAEQLFLEKPAGSTGKFDYVVLKTNRTSTLERELAENVARGFRLIWAGFGMRYMAILEKDFGDLDGGTRDSLPAASEVKLIATERLETAQKELTEQAAQGFRVSSGFLAGGPPPLGEVMLLLEKKPDEKEVFDYILFRETGAAALKGTLNDAGSRGYRLVPSATMSSRKSAITVAVMEKPPSHQASYEYLVLETKSPSEMAKEIQGAVADGFEFATVSSENDSRPVFIFERAGTRSALQ